MAKLEVKNCFYGHYVTVLLSCACDLDTACLEGISGTCLSTKASARGSAVHRSLFNRSTYGACLLVWIDCILGFLLKRGSGSGSGPTQATPLQARDCADWS